MVTNVTDKYLKMKILIIPILCLLLFECNGLMNTSEENPFYRIYKYYGSRDKGCILLFEYLLLRVLFKVCHIK